MHTDLSSALRTLILDHLHDPDASWACGRFGAIAEFHRDAGEAVEIAGAPAAVAATERGAIRIDFVPELRAVAYETISRCIESWGHGVALCLPCERACLSGRSVVSELGPDGEAVRAEDRDAVLFDLGIGGRPYEICVRSADPETIALLRSACGRPLLSQEAVMRQLARLSPHRVFCSRLGRVEVYQAIPAADGRTPDGPHTHLLPRLLAQGRSHAATVPVPDGWVAGMTLFPAHPLLRADGAATAFDKARHDAFQSLMTCYGDRALLAGKLAALGQPHEMVDETDPADTRRRALGFRIARRQARWLQNAT